METLEIVDILTMLVPFVVVIFIIAVGVVLLNQQFHKNLYKKQLEQETLKTNHQQELLQNSISIQEEERKRIAQDLHDELGAALSISKMQLLQLERQEFIPHEKLKQIRENIENTLSTTRRISHELMPLQLEKLGLERALKSQIKKLEESGVLKGNIAFSSHHTTLNQLTELGLYRIYSELINNTLKYGEASEINISIIKTEQHLFCNYADNGKGMQKQHTYNGLGMKSINNRVESLHGSWEYGNREEGGFYTQIKLPLI